MEERQFSKQTVLEQWDADRMNPDTDYTLFTKMNSKWLTDLNVKYKTINPLEEKHRRRPGRPLV